MLIFISKDKYAGGMKRSAVAGLRLGTESLLVTGAGTAGESWGKFLEPSAVSEWVSLAKCVFPQRPGRASLGEGAQGTGLRAPHTLCAHPQAHGRGDTGTLQKRVLWETEVVTHFCDFHKLHSMSKISEKSSPTPKQP